jgi:hypothetical protein
MAIPGNHNVRIPPDSTGKRIGHTLTVELYFSNLTGSFENGQVVVGSVSGASGEIVAIYSDHLDLHVKEGQDYIFSVGENILVENILQATVSASYPIFHQKSVIASGKNSNNVARVDPFGSLYVRNREGEGNFDSFGNYTVSGIVKIAEYVHTYDDLPDLYYDNVTLGSSITHSPIDSGVLLSCPTANGAIATRTSHLYHKYRAGYSQLINFTIALGDDGKTNVTRRWGYFDGYDGVFFEHNGLDLSVVIRSSCTGSIVENRILQEDWNGDTADGSGGLRNLSGENIDLTKNRIWWIDLQWLGAGVVRFGTYTSSGRVTLHEEYHSGLVNVSYMRTASLPIRVEQFNTGVSASTSEMKFFCASVGVAGGVISEGRRFGQSLVPTTLVDGYGTVLFSVRSKQTWKGVGNRVVAVPLSLNIYASNSPVIISVVKNAELVGDTWSLDAGPHTSVEADGYAVSFSGGETVLTTLVSANSAQVMSISGENAYIEAVKMYRHANVENYDSFSVVARCINVNDTASVTAAFNWKEIG